MWPKHRFFVRCWTCLYEELILPGNAYPPRCPDCGAGGLDKNPVEIRFRGDEGYRAYGLPSYRL